MIPRDFHFAHPAAFFYILALIPVVLVLPWSYRKRLLALNQLVQSSALQRIAVMRDPVRIAIKAGLFFLGWTLAVIALMRPQGNESYMSGESSVQAIPKSEQVARLASQDLFLLIDTSQSMAVADARNGQRRLDRAIDIADRLLSHVKQDQVALYAFTSNLVAIVPLTFDAIFNRLMLRELQINEGDSAGTSLLQIFTQLKKAEMDALPNQPKVVVLFSDGGDTAIEALSGEKREQAIGRLAEEVQNLKLSALFTVGIGTAEGGIVPDVLYKGQKVTSKLDAELLQALSAKTNGRYFAAQDQTAEQLGAAIALAVDQARTLGPSGMTSEGMTAYHEYFQIPLAFSILAFLLAYLYPSVRKTKALALLLAFFPSLLTSAESAQNPGEAYFQAGQYPQAAEWYLAEIERYPEGWLRDKLLYNAGTALAASNSTTNALFHFEEVSNAAYDSQLLFARMMQNRILMLKRKAEKAPAEDALQYLQNAFQLALISLEALCKDPSAKCRSADLSSLSENLQQEISALMSSEESNTKKPSQAALLYSLHSLLQVNGMLAQRAQPAWDILEQQIAYLAKEYPDEKTFTEIKKDFPQEGQDAKFWLFNTDHAILGLMLKDAASSELVLENLVLEAIALENRLTLVAEKNEAAASKAIASNAETLQEAHKDFYTRIGAEQQAGYQNGKCQCHPWDKVIPEFAEGVIATAGGKESLKGLNKEDGLLFTQEAILHFEKALNMLKAPPQEEKKEQQKAESQAVRELQEMQKLDREKKPVKSQHPLEDKPW